MIRLMLLSFMVFSGVYFFVGKDTPSRPDYVTQVSFDDTDKNSSLNHSYDQAQKQKPQIDLSILRNSIETLGVTLSNGYQKTKVYFFPKKTELQKSATLTTSKNKAPARIKTLHIAKANIKPVTSRKMTKRTKKQKKSSHKAKKLAHATMPLPMARPQPPKSQMAQLNTKIQQYLGIDKRPVASFRDFVTTSKQKKAAIILAKNTVSPTKFDKNGLIQRAAAPKSNKFTPRFLTSLIKRELKRLNCFDGAITPSWNITVQDRIKSLKKPLNSATPSLATLNYLQSQKSLRCVTQQDKSAQLPIAAKKKIAAAPKSSLTKQERTLAKAATIVLRDRSGKIIPTEELKQAAAAKTAPLQTASMSNQKPEILFQEKDDDYAFAPQNTAYNSERPPALTVGIRTANNGSTFNLNAVSNIARKKKIVRKRHHKAKKRKQWINDAFSND